LSEKPCFQRIWALLANWFAIVLLAFAGTQLATAQGTITGLNPPSVPAGSPQLNLLISVTNLPQGFAHVVYWNSQQLVTSDVNPGLVLAVVPSTLLALPGPASVVVQTLAGNPLNTAPAIFNIAGPTIASLQPASVVAGSSAFLLTVNGTGFISFSEAPNPNPIVNFGSSSGSSLTAALISNTQLQVMIPAALVASPGVVNVVVVDPDPYATTSAPFQFTIGAPPPQIVPLQFTTSTLPQGQVGVGYSASFAATGGTPPYSFSLVPGGGSLPAGLSFVGNGEITGTPNAMGTSKFTVQLQDGSGNVVNQAFTVTIVPAPLSIATGALSNGTVGTPLSIVFTATGGYPGYTFSSDAAIPSGTAFSSNGTLSGTPTIAGTYRFTVTVKDTAGTTASKLFSITIVPTPLAILTSALPNGQAGVGYSVQFYAAYGQPPYAWAAAGAPAGIAMSATGSFSGTPTADGSFTVTVTVTDSAKNQAQKSYSLTVAAAPLLITTATLAPGVAGTAYSAALAVTGGDGPYTWTVQGLPTGIAATAAGALSGTPASAGSYTVTAKVTDSKGVTATRSYNLTVTAAPISITTPSLPGGTVGSAYNVTVSASGGAGSNQWAATNLPGGLAMSASGTISGTPTAPGESIVVVTVTDAAGTVGVQTYTLTIGLPATPPVNFSNLPATGTPGTQSNVQVGMGSAYPLPVTATLTLTFTPDSGADDPSVQFSTGGRVMVVQIPAGSTALAGTAAIQMGTVAGTIAIVAQLSAAGQDITPTPPPTQTIRIAAAAPAISSVTAIRNASGFTVTVIGFSTPRQVTQATFQFAAAASANLQTSSLPIATTSLFTGWYSSAAAAPFGSQFSFVQPFTVTGDSAAIASVTVTLTNAQGTSPAVTANLQ
jgi:hypothetical protein